MTGGWCRWHCFTHVISCIELQLMTPTEHEPVTIFFWIGLQFLQFLAHQSPAFEFARGFYTTISAKHPIARSRSMESLNSSDCSMAVNTGYSPSQSYGFIALKITQLTELRGKSHEINHPYSRQFITVVSPWKITKSLSNHHQIPLKSPSSPFKSPSNPH